MGEPQGNSAGRVAPFEAAVIDVGSNSVRLVIFKVDGRAVTPILNEKVMAGLGRGLWDSGTLSPEGRDVALAALKRFATLVEARGVSAVHAVATAAVRTAKDGPAFVERAAKHCGVDLRVIEGREEARLSALGVLAGAPDARGVVGDLGGSSLELIPVGGDGVGEGETFPLGPLALSGLGPFDADKVGRHAAAELAETRLFSKADGDAFYAVGGAWRALGRIDITLRQHPIGVLHQHEMSRAEAQKVIAFVRKQSSRSLEKFEEAAAKRADSLPYAAAVLAQVLEAGSFSRVVLSSYGLREGVLFDAMDPALRRQDALVCSAQAFGAPTAGMRAFGASLNAWVDPVFASGPFAFDRTKDQGLRRAAAALADFGGALHPDQREDLVFDLVLRAPLAGVTHRERAFLAAAVQHRYSKTLPQAAELIVARLLTSDQARIAGAVGLAMRLGADLSGRSEALISRFTLKRQDQALVLSAGAGFGHLLTEQALRRLEPLAEGLQLKAQVKRR
jgi:exopolyphosphatase / guanosine-5'-triphosphate,3'-diphosphate pyrophosphatase